MRHRSALLLAFLVLSACSVGQREEAKQPAPSTRLSGGGFSEAVPVRKATISSRPTRPFLEGNLLAEQEADIVIPEGTPYLADNPEAAKVCAEAPILNDNGILTFPVRERFAHLPNLGQFFTAWSCGLRRVRELPAVHGDEYIAPLSLTLAEPPTGDFEDKLFMAGFTCTAGASAKNCLTWSMTGGVRIDLLARLAAFGDKIVKE